MALAVTAGTFAAASGRRHADASPSSEPRVIEVVARRFTFEPPEIDVTAGERVRIVVRSGDGMHGFEIKRFQVSAEIPRGGDPVVIELTPVVVGRFPILCSVFCGDGHDDMKGALVVRAREEVQR